MSGITVTSARGTVIVPIETELEGAAAIDAYVEAELSSQEAQAAADAEMLAGARFRRAPDPAAALDATHHTEE